MPVLTCDQRRLTFAGHSPKAAKAFLDRMAEARRNLARFPDLGLGIERLPIPGSHRLIVGDYLLDYDLTDDAVLIVSIRHGRQKPLTAEVDEDFDYEQDQAASSGGPE